MKFINLKIMTVPRLKAYRRHLYARIGAFERCSCGDSSCDFVWLKNQDNEYYKKLLIEKDRVNKELARKQMKVIEAEKNPAFVHTVREENAWIGKRDKNRVQLDPYYRRRAIRRKVREREAQTVTVIASYKEGGVPKEFTWAYDDLKMARVAVRRMKKNPYFTNPRIKR